MIWRILPLIGTLLLAGIVCLWRPWLRVHRYGAWRVIILRSKGPAHLLQCWWAHPLRFLNGAMAATASASTRWLSGSSAWPRTQCQIT